MEDIEIDDKFEYIFHIENPAFQGEKYKIGLCGVHFLKTSRHFFSLEDAYLEQLIGGRKIPCKNCLKSLIETMSSQIE